MQTILNAVGLIFGMIGTGMVFYFGLPSIDVLNEGAYVANEVTPKMRRYSNLSRVGLAMIALGFLSQFIALFVSVSK